MKIWTSDVAHVEFVFSPGAAWSLGVLVSSNSNVLVVRWLL